VNIVRTVARISSYRLNIRWLKFICCICQSNDLEREIKQKNVGRASRGSAKKKEKTCPIVTSLTENPKNLKRKYIFFSLNEKTCLIRRGCKHLSSSIGWRAMVLQTWTKKWSGRDEKLLSPKPKTN